MKNYTVRLPEALIAELEAESRRREVSTAEIVRERLQRYGTTEERSEGYERIKDLIGSVEGLPADLSSRKKHYLRTTGYGRKRSR